MGIAYRIGRRNQPPPAVCFIKRKRARKPRPHHVRHHAPGMASGRQSSPVEFMLGAELLQVKDDEELLPKPPYSADEFRIVPFYGVGGGGYLVLGQLDHL